jgi:hypothetical protein
MIHGNMVHSASQALFSKILWSQVHDKILLVFTHDTITKSIFNIINPEMKKILYLIMAAALLSACNNNQDSQEITGSPVGESSIEKTIDLLMAQTGNDHQTRIEKGVRQVAALWRPEDGSVEDFENFCSESFINDPDELKLVFEKVSRNFEILGGHLNKISLDLQIPLHLDVGPIHSIDEKFGAYSPSSHLQEDFYKNKIAFMVALNFPTYSLDEKTQLGPGWSRLEWAYARMGDVYKSRPPSELSQKFAEVNTATDIYISDYNLFVGQLLDQHGNTLFPGGMKLLLHWNLRDEIKSNYSVDNGLEKQRLIYEAMKRIISQEIPLKIINSEEFQWNPYTNELFKDGQKTDFTAEGAARYQQLLNNFHALSAFDPYEPVLSTAILRSFDGQMEISQPDVEKLFSEFASSPELKEVADLIRKNLGRDLEAFDIWYDGFKPRSSISEEKLNEITRRRYPNPEAFEKDLPVLLAKLGFSKERAEEICSMVAVDPARGSGHAWGAEMKSEKARLRTRIGSDGMDYKGYNIAIHEFGHNVEQTISLHDVDYYMLKGVPNTGFTEALAFVFQKQDLALLGLNQADPRHEYMLTLDDFWGSFEIMGVSLVDMNVWKWMYANPDATAEELKQAVIEIAIEVWNEYFAEVFGVRDQTILAVYSHMISYPMYLPNYAVGALIQFQVEQYLKEKDFATEIERMYSIGRIIPEEWMKQAVGSGLSPEPMLKAAAEAITVINQ